MLNNPWLYIPASDYETHMASPHVGQTAFLSDMFREALHQHPCETVLLLGCATGNGLEHVDPARTSRVTAIDINPDYLELTRQRFGKSIPGLETVAGDLAAMTLERASYDLVFAGLVFEYVKPEVLLPRIANALKPGGVLSVVLQQPAENTNTVSGTTVESLRALSAVIRLVDPDHFRTLATEAGLVPLEERRVVLPSGKPFHVATFEQVRS